MGLFGHIHELPALVDGDRGRDFDEGVLPLLHDLEGHGDVPFPRSGDEDDVYIVAFKHFFPGMLVAEVHCGFFAGLLLDVFSGALGARFDDVADGDHFGERNTSRRIYVATSAIKTDDGDPDFFDGLSCKIPDRFIADRPRASGRDVVGVEEFEVARIRLGVSRRDGIQAKAETGDGAKLEKVAAIGIFGKVHGVSIGGFKR